MFQNRSETWTSTFRIFYVELAKIFILIFNVPILHEIFQNLFSIWTDQSFESMSNVAFIEPGLGYTLVQPRNTRLGFYNFYDWCLRCLVQVNLDNPILTGWSDFTHPDRSSDSCGNVEVDHFRYFEVVKYEKEQFWLFRPSLYRSYTCFIIQSVKPFLQFWKSFSFVLLSTLLFLKNLHDRNKISNCHLHSVF